MFLTESGTSTSSFNSKSFLPGVWGCSSIVTIVALISLLFKNRLYQSSLWSYLWIERSIKSVIDLRICIVFGSFKSDGNAFRSLYTFPIWKECFLKKVFTGRIKRVHVWRHYRPFPMASLFITFMYFLSIKVPWHLHWSPTLRQMSRWTPMFL